MNPGHQEVPEIDIGSIYNIDSGFLAIKDVELVECNIFRGFDRHHDRLGLVVEFQVPEQEAADIGHLETRARQDGAGIIRAALDHDRFRGGAAVGIADRQRRAQVVLTGVQQDGIARFHVVPGQDIRHR